MAQTKRSASGRKSVIALISGIREKAGLSQSQFANLLGVSVRTLHNAVFAIRGMSMHRYTRLRRLWNVRQQLVQGCRPESIKAIALVNGFWHLGEFLSLYRELFGETPQQTLAGREQVTTIK